MPKVNEHKVVMTINDGSDFLNNHPINWCRAQNVPYLMVKKSPSEIPNPRPRGSLTNKDKGWLSVHPSLLYLNWAILGRFLGSW